MATNNNRKTAISNMPIDFSMPDMPLHAIDVANIAEQMQKVTEEFERIRVTMTSRYQQVFYDVVKQLFSKHQCLKVIQWSQYTPYFNDGDECVFTVNEIFYTVKEPSGSDHETWYSESDEWIGAVPSDYMFENAEKYRKNLNDSPWGDYTVKIVDAYREACKEFGEENLVALGKDMTAFTRMVYDNQTFMRAMLGDHKLVTITKDGIDVSDYEHE